MLTEFLSTEFLYLPLCLSPFSCISESLPVFIAPLFGHAEEEFVLEQEPLLIGKLGRVIPFQVGDMLEGPWRILCGKFHVQRMHTPARPFAVLPFLMWCFYVKGRCPDI